MRTDDNQLVDLVWGAKAIACVIGRPVPATFHMLDQGELPAKKVGGRWVASRQKLVSHLIGEVVA